MARAVSTHTPGPWRLELPPDSADFMLCTIDVDADDDGRVQDYGHSIIEGTLVSGTTEEIEANARLIAAAPDLLAALSEFLEWFDTAFENPNAPIAANARAALLAARSEAPNAS